MEELAEIRGKQELYSGLYAEERKRYAAAPQHRYDEALPEENVRILQMCSIGVLPENMGNTKYVQKKLREMKRLGVDLARRPGDLTQMERAFIELHQNGVTTTQDIATELKISKAGARGLRLQVREKLGTPYQPDRTFTPREREFLALYNRGITRVGDLAAVLNTGDENIYTLRYKLMKKGVKIKFNRKVVLPDSILQYAPPRYRQEQEGLAEVRDELAEIREHEEAMPAAGGI